MYVVVLKGCGELNGPIGHVFQDHSESGFFPTIFYLVDPLCDDFENFCSIQLSDVASYEHLNAVLRRT